MTIQCCVCQRIKVEDTWKHRHVEHPQQVSHTYCPVCLEQSMKALYEETARNRKTIPATT